MSPSCPPPIPPIDGCTNAAALHPGAQEDIAPGKSRKKMEEFSWSSRGCWLKKGNDTGTPTIVHRLCIQTKKLWKATLLLWTVELQKAANLIDWSVQFVL